MVTGPCVFDPHTQQVAWTTTVSTGDVVLANVSLRERTYLVMRTDVVSRVHALTRVKHVRAAERVFSRSWTTRPGHLVLRQRAERMPPFAVHVASRGVVAKHNVPLLARACWEDLQLHHYSVHDDGGLLCGRYSVPWEEWLLHAIHVFDVDILEHLEDTASVRAMPVVCRLPQTIFM